MEEHWRDIPGYEGKYQIKIDEDGAHCRSLNYLGSPGRVQELSNKPNKNRRIYWNIGGYYRQAGYWVALAFPEICGDYFSGAEIDHIDTNPTNNNPYNLRWTDRNGQMNNILTKIHCSEARKGHKHSEETKTKMRKTHKNGQKILQFSLDGTFIKGYHSFYQLEKETGYSRGNIWAACQGLRESPYGFIWQYGD